MDDYFTRILSLFGKDKPATWGLALGTVALIPFWFLTSWGSKLYQNPAAIFPIWLGFWAIGTSIVWVSHGIFKSTKKYISDKIRKKRKSSEPKRMAKIISELEFEPFSYLRSKIHNTDTDRFYADKDAPHLNAILKRKGIITHDNWSGYYITALAREAIWANPEVLYLRSVTRMYGEGRVLQSDDEAWSEKMRRSRNRRRRNDR